MKFDLMGIVFLAVAIFAGNIAGAMITDMIGMSGGLIGSFIVGFVVYLIYALLTGQSIRLMVGVIFSLCVYGSGIVTVWISSTIGFGGGILGVVLQALVLSLIFGYFFKGQVKSPISQKTQKSSGRRRK